MKIFLHGSPRRTAVLLLILILACRCSPFHSLSLPLSLSFPPASYTERGKNIYHHPSNKHGVHHCHLRRHLGEGVRGRGCADGFGSRVPDHDQGRGLRELVR